MNSLTVLGTALLALAVWPASVFANDTAADGCISVKVGDYKALSYDCLSQQMMNSEGNAAERKNREAVAFDVSKRAPNQLGLFNQSATSIRMGNQFGVSVHPQRPGP